MNTTGTSTTTYSYGPYGEPNTTAGNMRFRYTGQTLLAPLGLYYYKARIYSPTLGRFLQTDPIGTADDMNLYGYVGNNPINYIDPEGLLAKQLLGQTSDDIFGITSGGYYDLNSGRFVEPGLNQVTPERYLIAPLRYIEMGVGKTNSMLDILPKPPTGKGTVQASQRDPQRTFSREERETKRTEQDDMCGNGCGTKIDASNSHGHHIIRHADGGATVSENHVEVCISCHKDLHKK